MPAAKPLVALLGDLLQEPRERAAYEADPEVYLAERGWDGIETADLAEAVGFARESLPFEVARVLPADPDAAVQLADAPGFEGSIELLDGLTSLAGAEPGDDHLALAFGAGAEPNDAVAGGTPEGGEDEDEIDGSGPADEEPLDFGWGDESDLAADSFDTAPDEMQDDASIGGDQPDAVEYEDRGPDGLLPDD